MAKSPWKNHRVGRIIAAALAAVMMISTASIAAADDSTTDTTVEVTSAAQSARAAAVAKGTPVEVSTAEALKTEIEKAQPGSALTIKITQDLTLSEPITVPQGANITITDDGDSNPEVISVSHQGTNKKNEDYSDYLFTVSQGATLNFNASDGVEGKSLAFTGIANTNTIAGQTSSLDALATTSTNGGTITFNGGIYSGFQSRRGAVASARGGGTITVNRGTFTGNKANVNGTNDKGGGVFAVLDGSALTIVGGTFENNVAGSDTIQSNGGGVVYANNGTVSIQGGTFKSNEANGNNTYVGGGALHIAGSQSKLSITGGVFQQNSVKQIMDYNHRFSGGGAIWAQGTIRISGGTFGNNTAGHVDDHKSVGGWAGGGAIFVYGTNNGAHRIASSLTIADPDNSDARTTFTNNQTDGDGGAIFLGWGSEAVMLGGSFSNNVSHRLGGAIYTEEETTTYMSRAFATQNYAGHFGGGLWLCPSGVGVASKAGNMIAVGNDADKKYDLSPTGTGDASTSNAAMNERTSAAGDDFSLMSPTKPNLTNSFELSDKGWGSENTTSVVQWWKDGTLTEYTDGLGYDSLLGGTDKDKKGLGVAEGSRRYDDQTTHGETDKQTAPYKFTSTNEDGNRSVGVALKATWIGATGQNQYAENANVSFTNNTAWYSGGAFGTNGSVVFDTPYRASWHKVDANDTSKSLAGSEWQLSIKESEITQTSEEGRKTPWFNDKFRLVQCTDQTNRDKNCWTKANGTDIWTATITDNGEFDQDPDDGVISLNNLALGTFTLKETRAPQGYFLSNKTYTFTTVKQGVPDITESDGGTASASSVVRKDADGIPMIGDSPVDVSWQKVDSTDAFTVLGGSEWTLEKRDDNNSDKWSYVTYTPAESTASGAAATTTQAKWAIDESATAETAYRITDCVAAEESQCTGADKDPAAGKFRITGLGLPADRGGLGTSGTYRLTEVKAPEGYFLDSTPTHEFTISKNMTGPVNIGNVTGDNADGSNKVPNVPNRVTWQKADRTTSSKLLSGSEWKIQTLVKDGSGAKWIDIAYVPASETAAAKWDIADAGSTPTAAASTITDCTADNKVQYSGLDKDCEAGKFQVEGLPISFDNTATGDYASKGLYRLVETKAPADYELPKLPSDSPVDESGDTDGAYYRFAIRQPERGATEIFVPLTKGTTALYVAGFVVVAVAGFGLSLVWRRRRRSLT